MKMTVKRDHPVQRPQFGGWYGARRQFAAQQPVGQRGQKDPRHERRGEGMLGRVDWLPGGEIKAERAFEEFFGHFRFVKPAFGPLQLVQGTEAPGRFQLRRQKLGLALFELCKRPLPDIVQQKSRVAFGQAQRAVVEPQRQAEAYAKQREQRKMGPQRRPFRAVPGAQVLSSKMQVVPDFLQGGAQCVAVADITLVCHKDPVDQSGQFGLTSVKYLLEPDGLFGVGGKFRKVQQPVVLFGQIRCAEIGIGRHLIRIKTGVDDLCIHEIGEPRFPLPGAVPLIGTFLQRGEGIRIERQRQLLEQFGILLFDECQKPFPYLEHLRREIRRILRLFLFRGAQAASKEEQQQLEIQRAHYVQHRLFVRSLQQVFQPASHAGQIDPVTFPAVHVQKGFKLRRCGQSQHFLRVFQPDFPQQQVELVRRHVAYKSPAVRRIQQQVKLLKRRQRPELLQLALQGQPCPCRAVGNRNAHFLGSWTGSAIFCSILANSPLKPSRLTISE